MSLSLAVFQDVVRRACDRWPVDRSRIEKAAQLIALDAVVQIEPDAYIVRSQTDEAVIYCVTPDGCECVDAHRHPSHCCKHRFAVDLLRVAEERQQRLDARQAEQVSRSRESADRVALATAASVRRAA